MLEKEKFKEWLEGFQDSHIVGTSHSLSDCPVANFLEFCVKEGVMVYKLGYLTGSKQEKRVLNPMPVWMRNFINIVDLNKKQTKLTTKQALEILAQIKEN